LLPARTVVEIHGVFKRRSASRKRVRPCYGLT
jgi:hypothetical protein